MHLFVPWIDSLVPYAEWLWLTLAVVSLLLLRVSRIPSQTNKKEIRP